MGTSDTITPESVPTLTLNPNTQPPSENNSDSDSFAVPAEQFSIFNEVYEVYREEYPPSTDAQATECAEKVILGDFPPRSTACLIEKMPLELLSHVFWLGMTMEEEEAGEQEEDEKDEDEEEEEEEDEEEEDGDEKVDQDEEDSGRGHDSNEDQDVQDTGNGGTKAKGDSNADQNADKDDTNDDNDDAKSNSTEESGYSNPSPRNPKKYSLPFEILVSHVCRLWRETALSNATLWTKIYFAEPPPFEKSVAYIERSRSQPLDVGIFCQIPEGLREDDHPANALLPPTAEHSPGHDQVVVPNQDVAKGCNFLSRVDLARMLDIVVPHIARWEMFYAKVDAYSYMYVVLQRLAVCGPAPRLKSLKLNHNFYEPEENITFEPPPLATPFTLFGSKKGEINCPQLESIYLYGVHLDWTNCGGIFHRIHTLALNGQAGSVRPSFDVFRQFIVSSPELTSLKLSLSGPAHDRSLGTIGSGEITAGVDEDDSNFRWDNKIIKIPSLYELDLSEHDPDYAASLINHLVVPNLRRLSLYYYNDADYTSFAFALARSSPNSYHTGSALRNLEYLSLVSLPCSDDAAHAVLGQLIKLRRLRLDCIGPEKGLFFEKLMLVRKDTNTIRYCPSLKSVSTIGLPGGDMLRLVKRRRSVGCGLRTVRMCYSNRTDYLEDDVYMEISESVEIFDYFFNPNVMDEGSLFATNM